MSDTRAEALAVAIVRKYSDHGEIAALSLAPGMIREYGDAMLEAAAKDVQERGMKEAATVIRRRKEDPDA